MSPTLALTGAISRSTFYEYPHELTPPGKTAALYLRELTFEGLARRYPHGTSAHVLQQIEHELHLLSELQYEHFVHGV